MRKSSSPRAGACRRLEVSLELTLDSTLGSTARLILCGLAAEDAPVVWPTDQELADRHGVSLRTVGNALAAGERAGWIRRAKDRAEMVELFPELAKRVPRSGRNTPRLIILLWLDAGLPTAPACRQPVANQPVAVSNPLPAPTAPNCQPLACAPGSAFSELRTSEIRTTFVPPLSPPESTSLIPGWAKILAESAERESRPGYTPAPEWKPPPYTGGVVGSGKPPAAKRLKVEEMVAACIGPDAQVGLDALVLWLMAELGDVGNAITRASWSRNIPRILETADGFGRLIELILDAGKKPKPANWLSACLARGQPSAQKEPTPGASWQASPGAGAKAAQDRGPSQNKYTRRVNS
jgi:hypothetical protein